MTRTLSLRAVRVLAVTLGLGLAACSGGGGGNTQRDRPDASGESRASAREPTTTAAPTAPRIDLSEPIPGGSLHGTPRPPLENTGTDYVAILESLIGSFRWLTENPDPVVISELYVPGTEDHAGQVSLFEELVSRNLRAADDGYHLISIETVDTQQQVASLRVTDSMDFERIVDANGVQVGDGRARTPKVKTWLVLLTSDSADRWRIADWAPADGGTVDL